MSLHSPPPSPSLILSPYFPLPSPPPSQNAKEETAAALEEARQASEEVRALRSLTARILLTPEEKEEVVLKRCWLARYWALAAKHGGWVPGWVGGFGGWVFCVVRGLVDLEAPSWSPSPIALSSQESILACASIEDS